MTIVAEDVVAIAVAIANTNGHSHPHEWASKVAKEWAELTEKENAVDESSTETDDASGGAQPEVCSEDGHTPEGS